MNRQNKYEFRQPLFAFLTIPLDPLVDHSLGDQLILMGLGCHDRFSQVQQNLG